MLCKSSPSLLPTSPTSPALQLLKCRSMAPATEAASAAEAPRIEWLGGYWKLPAEDLNCSDLSAKIISKARQGTAPVEKHHLQEAGRKGGRKRKKEAETRKEGEAAQVPNIIWARVSGQAGPGPQHGLRDFGIVLGGIGTPSCSAGEDMRGRRRGPDQVYVSLGDAVQQVFTNASLSPQTLLRRVQVRRRGKEMGRRMNNNTVNYSQ